MIIDTRCAGHSYVRSIRLGPDLVILAMLVCSSGSAWAQERQRASWNVPESDSAYTQRLNVEVGDVPGHMVRIYEIRKRYSINAPVFAGVRAVEAWDRGTADYVDLNGPSSGYSIFQMENGDKVFARFDGAVRTVVGPDGRKQTTYSGTTVLTGGTGRFKGIRGLFHETDHVDIAQGRNETSGEGDYWFER